MTASTSDSKPCSRSEHRVALAGLAALGLSLLAVPLRSSAASEETPSSGVSSLMKDLSVGYEALAEALEGEAAIGPGVERLDLGFGKLPAVLPELEEDDGFQGLVSAARAGLREVRELATEGRYEGARQAFADVRGSCVECHVRYRDENEARGLYPAEGNTIAGRVRLVDVDGEEQEDRSWVLLFLESQGEEPAWVHERTRPAIRQRGRRFHPRVLPVVRGSWVEFPNDDTIFHNVFSLSRTHPFDLGTYSAGESKAVQMTKTGLIKVYCNIHPEMQANVVVLANPWFDVTDRSGAFAITDVPDGEYVLRAWNERGASTSRKVTVADGALLELEVDLKETRRVLPHKNKFGKPYREKY